MNTDETLAEIEDPATNGFSPTIRVLRDVVNERKRQDEKWGSQNRGRPTSTWVTILLEELFEALDEEDGSRAQQAELVQCTAVLAKWTEHCRSAVPDDSGIRADFRTSLEDLGQRAMAHLEGSDNA